MHAEYRAAFMGLCNNKHYDSLPCTDSIDAFGLATWHSAYSTIHACLRQAGGAYNTHLK